MRKMVKHLVYAELLFADDSMYSWDLVFLSQNFSIPLLLLVSFPKCLPLLWGFSLNRFSSTSL
jgi:hypothetical protein